MGWKERGMGTVVMHRSSGTSQQLMLSLFFTLLLWSNGATAFPDPRALPDCSCTDRTEALALRDQIAKADTLEAAQELALPPAEQTRAALARARWLVPERLAPHRGDAALRRSGRRAERAQPGAGRSAFGSPREARLLRRGGQ
jgi:hypothetical protein